MHRPLKPDGTPIPINAPKDVGKGTPNPLAFETKAKKPKEAKKDAEVT